MIDVLLAASPPVQVRPAATKFAPPKVEEAETFSADFEKALKAKHKELDEADATRTAQTASQNKPVRKPERSPQAGSQGETGKAGAAGQERTPEMEDALEREPNQEAETVVSVEAGAGAVQAQAQAITPQPAAQPVQQAPAQAVTAAMPMVQMLAEAQQVETLASAALPINAVGQPGEAVDPRAAPQANAEPQDAPSSTGTVHPDVKAAGEVLNLGKDAPVTFTQVLQQMGQADPASVQPAAAQPQRTQKASGAVSRVETEQPAVKAEPTGVPTGGHQQLTAAQASAAVSNMPTVKAVKAAEQADISAQAASPVTGVTGTSTVVAQSGEIKAASGPVNVLSGQAVAAARPLEMMEQVSKVVEASLQQGKNTLRMQLNPAELGAIDIRLVSSGHRVSMTVIAEQASTGRMLENQAEQLRQTLADAGIQLSQLHVGQQGQGGQFTRNFQQQPQTFSGLRFGQQGLSEEAEPAFEPARRAAGKVDYRV